jgi:hypothetical protein
MKEKKIICAFIEAWTNSRAKLRDEIQFMYEKKLARLVTQYEFD